MMKMTIQRLSSTVMLLASVIISNQAIADQMFNMDDISDSLQTEYQSQLVLRPQAKYKAVAPVARKAKAPKQIIQRKIAQRQIVAKKAKQYVPPVRKAAPVPQAEDLFDAASQGNVSVIGRLIREGVNVNVANAERETALHIAAARGRYSAVIYLINQGGNIHSRTIKNWLPLHHATRFRHANIANYLLKKGSSPHARTSDGLSAIDMARSAGNRQLLGLFGAN